MRVGLDNKMAIQCYKQAVLLNPFDLRSYYGLLDFYYEHSLFEDYYFAIFDYVEIRNSDVEALIEAYPYFVIGKKKTAIDEVTNKFRGTYFEQMIPHLKLVEESYLGDLTKIEALSKIDSYEESSIKRYLLSLIVQIWDYESSI